MNVMFVAADVNVTGTIQLLNTCEKFGCNSFVFSSSTIVYQTCEISPVNEEAVIGKNIPNPYGRTKFVIEELLKVPNRLFSVITHLTLSN